MAFFIFRLGMIKVGMKDALGNKLSVIATTLTLLAFSGAALAFDASTAVSSFNIARGSDRNEARDIRDIKKLVRKTDGSDSLFVTRGMEEKAFVARFEQVLSRSGLIPSEQYQRTPFVKVEMQGFVVHEAWFFKRFDLEGKPVMSANRVFLLCERQAISVVGSIQYDYKGNDRTLNNVFYDPMLFNPQSYRGDGKEEYLAICNASAN